MSNGGDDPWAKWRKPDGPSSEPAAPAAPAAKPSPEVQPAKSDTSGTLTVNKTARADKAPAGRGRPGGKPGGASAWGGKPAGRAGGERRSESKPESDGRPPRRERSEGRSERPEGARRPAEAGWGRASERPAGEDRKPYDRAAGEGPRKPRERAPVADKRPFRREDQSDDSQRDMLPARPPRPARDPGAPAPEGTRLSKVMSERGMCSRREADLWIERGWVFVNGQQISELGTRIDASADITISREAKQTQAKQVTILLNKPVGYVSGQPEPDCVPAVKLINGESQVQQSGDPEFKPWMLRGLAPAGRLDVDSTGLLVLTQDGRVAKRLIGDDSDVEKEYLVRVEGELIKDGLKLLNHGLELDGKALRPARVKQLNEDQLHFILKEGKKRQIRRMCELVGLRVIGLKRVRIGRVKLGDLQLGQWRFLRADESF